MPTNISPILSSISEDLPKRSYSRIVQRFESIGLFREQIVANETNSFVEVFNLRPNTIGDVVTLESPETNILTIRGANNAQTHSWEDKAYSTSLRLANNLGQNIALDTKLIIDKIDEAEHSEVQSKPFYGDISMVKNLGIKTDQIFKSDNELYRFRHNIIIKPGERLRIRAVNSNLSIDSENTLFAARIDFWSIRS